MTNRQWMLWQMVDMSDEELIKYFGCEVCAKYVIQNGPCPADCDPVLLAWFKQELKEG